MNRKPCLSILVHISVYNCVIYQHYMILLHYISDFRWNAAMDLNSIKGWIYFYSTWKTCSFRIFYFFIRKLMGDGWMDGDCINMKVTHLNQRKYSMIEWYCPNTVNQMTVRVNIFSPGETSYSVAWWSLTGVCRILFAVSVRLTWVVPASRKG